MTTSLHNASWFITGASGSFGKKALEILLAEYSPRRIGIFSRDELKQFEMRDQGVGTQVLYIPVHLQPWYRNTHGNGAGKCSNAEAAYAGLLSLPLFPNMTHSNVDQVIRAVKALDQKPIPPCA